MIYAAILAGGVGRRMAGDKPKQYMDIGGRPILIHTIEKFCLCSAFEEILLLCPEDWVVYTQELIRRHLPKDAERIRVLPGGDMRNETVCKAVTYLEENGALDEETILVTHDAVRPFVSYRILCENIETVQQCGICDTVIPATDTIVRSTDGATITDIPLRSELYQGQTPQSFRAAEWLRLYKAISPEERRDLTDAITVFARHGRPVHLVAGESNNIKITVPFDLTVAESMLRSK